MRKYCRDITDWEVFLLQHEKSYGSARQYTSLLCVAKLHSELSVHACGAAICSPKQPASQLDESRCRTRTTHIGCQPTSDKRLS